MDTNIHDKHTTDRILVVGATGTQGGAVASDLLTHGHRVRILTRDPTETNAQLFARAGAEIAGGDMDDPTSLNPVEAGARGLHPNVVNSHDYMNKIGFQIDMTV